MISRLRYILRETFDSFRRNATLTVASIITALKKTDIDANVVTKSAAPKGAKASGDE